jgi:hypothetical protein
MQVVSTRFDYATDLLQSLVKESYRPPTTLVICHSRDDLLAELIAQLTRPHNEDDSTPGDASTIAHADTLLVPTLSILAVSTNIHIVYCSNISTARAYLSSYKTGADHHPSSRLVILDLIALHHGTSEFTLQGISRTLATAVSAASNNGCDLMLVECKTFGDQTDSNRGPRLWDAEVRLLSGSIKISLEGSKFVGRSLPIRRIAARWFTFESPDRSGEHDGRTEDADEEMLI